MCLFSKLFCIDSRQKKLSNVLCKTGLFMPQASFSIKFPRKRKTIKEQKTQKHNERPPPHTHNLQCPQQMGQRCKYKALHNIIQKKFKVLLFLRHRKPGIISSVLESRTMKAARTRKPFLILPLSTLQHLIHTIRVRCFFPLA